MASDRRSRSGRSSISGVQPNKSGAMPAVGKDAPLEARWIVAELHATAAKVNQSLENYRYDDAANTIYQFFWGSFCDWYLEIVKLRLDFSETADKTATKAALTTLVAVFEAALRLLSPFMPFLTEEIWHALYDGNPPAKSIALTRYPTGVDHLNDGAVLDMAGLQSLITEATAEPRPIPNPSQQLVDVAFRLRNQFLDRQLAALMQRANQPESSEAERDGLLRQQQELRRLKRQPI